MFRCFRAFRPCGGVIHRGDPWAVGGIVDIGNVPREFGWFNCAVDDVGGREAAGDGLFPAVRLKLPRVGEDVGGHANIRRQRGSFHDNLLVGGDVLVAIQDIGG